MSAAGGEPLHPPSGGGPARFALPVAVAMVLVSALRWAIADWLTPFGWGLIAVAVWAAALFTAIAILVARKVPDGAPPRPTAPALLIVGGALLAIYGPWAELDLRARWSLQRGARERAVEWIRAERPAPDPRGRVELPSELRQASATGGDVRVARTDADSAAVLFFTYRGVPSGYAGFLHVPSGRVPGRFAGDRLLHVRAMAPGWYFVAAR